MWTAGLIFCCAMGLMTLRVDPIIGMTLVGLGIWCGSKVTHEDVTRLTGALFLLAIVGAALAFLGYGPMDGP